MIVRAAEPAVVDVGHLTAEAAAFLAGTAVPLDDDVADQSPATARVGAPVGVGAGGLVAVLRAPRAPAADQSGAAWERAGGWGRRRHEPRLARGARSGRCDVFPLS